MHVLFLREDIGEINSKPAGSFSRDQVSVSWEKRHGLDISNGGKESCQGRNRRSKMESQ